MCKEGLAKGAEGARTFLTGHREDEEELLGRCLADGERFGVLLVALRIDLGLSMC